LLLDHPEHDWMPHLADSCKAQAVQYFSVVEGLELLPNQSLKLTHPVGSSSLLPEFVN
jgi:hypothetical protein